MLYLHTLEDNPQTLDQGYLVKYLVAPRKLVIHLMNCITNFRNELRNCNDHTYMWKSMVLRGALGYFLSLKLDTLACEFAISSISVSNWIIVDNGGPI